MNTHRIDLMPPPKKHGRTLMSYNGKAIGSSNAPIYAAARWLLDSNAAFPDDIVETYRDGKLGNPTFFAHGGTLGPWSLASGRPKRLRRHHDPKS